MTSFYTSTGMHICNLCSSQKPAIFLAKWSSLTTNIPVYQLYNILSLFSWIDYITTSDWDTLELYQFIELFNRYTNDTFLI